MIVHDLNIVSVAFAPDKAETPLVVDPDAILSFSVTMQCLQTIPRRCHQISQLRGGVQLPNLPASYVLDCLKAPTWLSIVKSLSFCAAERLNHDMKYITYSV